MANPNAPFGLKAVRNLDGTPIYTEKVSISANYATALFIGDPVVYTTTSAHKDTTARYQTVIRSSGATTVLIRGVIFGFAPLPTNLELLHNPASTARIAYIVPATLNTVFQIRDDGAGTPAAVWVGSNSVCVTGSGGSTVTGLSSYALDGSVHTDTQAHSLHILGLADEPDNELEDYAVWEVQLNTCYNATGMILGVVAA